MTINAIVACVESPLNEPSIVAILEASGMNSLEIPFPREQFASDSAPELLGLLNGFFVQLLVVL